MSIAACPRCEGQVTLPPGARPAAQVKCPLCEAQYALSDIYDKLPPMLVLLEAPVEARTAAGGMTHGESAFDSLFVPSSDANGEGELHLATEVERDAMSFDFGGSGGGTALATAPSAKTLPARAKRPPKNPIKEGVKIVLGGVVGLSIGYFILLWAFDQDLCARIAKKPVGEVLPAWMHWSLPAKHKPAAPVANDGNAKADEDSSSGADQGGDAKEGNDGGADADAPNGQSGVKETQTRPGDVTDTATGDASDTAARTDASSDDSATNNSQPGVSADGNATGDATDAGASSETTQSDQSPSPDDSTPKSPSPKAESSDDAGRSAPRESSGIDIDDPTLDVGPPSSTPPIETPKITDLFPGVDPGALDEGKSADDPSSKAPADTAAPEKSPAPADDVAAPAVPDEPILDPAPNETEPAQPTEASAGLKVDNPIADDAVAAANSAASGALDVLIPDDAAAKTAFTRAKFAAYTKLCEFANAVSQTDPSTADANVPKAKSLIEKVLADDANARTLGQLANAWLSKTRANDGIALSGKVTAVDTAGGLTTITVELPALEGRLAVRSATIVTRETADIKAGDEVAAVGSVVEKPTERINGYAGGDAQVIWGAWVGKWAE